MNLTNRAAVLYGTADLRIEDREIPVPGPKDVLVQIHAVGVCGSDVHYYDHGRIGPYVVREPMILGHESSGVVVGTGSEANRHAVGTRVALEPGVPCGRCLQCRSGRYNLCPDVKFFATPPIDGTFANYVTIDEDFAHPIPDSMSFDAAALIEPLSVGVWACRRGQVTVGTSVLVTGAGPIGLCALQAALAAGAAEVAVADVRPSRLDLARQLGASMVIDLTTTTIERESHGVDVLIECSGADGAFHAGIAALHPAGRAVLVGMGADLVELPVTLIQSRELVLTGTFRYSNTYPAAIAMAASGRVNLDALVTDHFPLEESEQALLAGRTRADTVKVIVNP